MPNQLPFFGREAELNILHDAWCAATDATTRTPQIVTLVAETGVGKSRIIQEFYRQLTVDAQWDPDNFWPDAFQSHATQLRVNPEFPADYAPDGPPRFLWLGMRWHNAEERNVANSLALPTIKEQLIQFTNSVNAMRSRWQHILDAATTEVRKLMTIHGALNATLKFVPYGDLLSNLWEYGKDIAKAGAGIPSAPQALPEQLTYVLHTWFSQTDATPIILWLDDAQWMDPEAQAFFAQLMHTARNKRWPLLLIATSWPAEWRAFPHDFFLKHDTATTYELGNAADAELQELLHAAFPKLPRDQVALIVDRAGGNFLTMIENIAELRNEPMYFVNADTEQPLTPDGITLIHEWESDRQKRITQRFKSFDTTIRNFLARASHTGLNTQFLHNVLVRWSVHNPHVGDVTELLRRSQESLAVVMPFSPQLHEFRDRGYFAVAQQHFQKFLALTESDGLQHALIAELTERVQSAFDADGNLCDPQAHPTSLRAAPRREQYVILDLALRLIPANTPHFVQALVAMVASSVAENAWDEIRTLIQPRAHTADASYFDQIDWGVHAGNSVSWRVLLPFTNTLYDAGAITQAGVLRTHDLACRRAQHAQLNTADTLRNLSESLNHVGIIHRDNGDLTAALQCYTEALDLSRQFVQTRGTPEDLRGLSVTVSNVGSIHRDNGDLPAALQCYTEDLTISRQLVQSRGTPDDLQGLSATLNEVGRIHRDNGDLTAALQCYTEALDLSHQLVQTRGTPDDLRNLSVSLNFLGNFHQENGDLPAALQCYTEDLTISRQLVQTRGTPEDLRGLSVTVSNVGSIHRDNGDLPAALQCYTEGLTISRQAVQTRGTPEDLRNLSFSLHNVGNIHKENGDLQAAMQCYTEDLTISRQLVQSRGTPDDRHNLSVRLNFLGNFHQENGDLLAALQFLSESIDLSIQLVQSRALPDDLINLFVSLKILGNIHRANGDFPAALQCYKEALDISRHLVQTRGLPDDLLPHSRSLNIVGHFFLGLGMLTEALESLNESLDLCRQLMQIRGTALDLQCQVVVLSMLVTIHQNKGDPLTALPYAKEALSIAQQARLHDSHIFSDAELAVLARRVQEIAL